MMINAKLKSPFSADTIVEKVLWALFAVYACEIIITAWMCDDAFITYDTAHMFWNGHGLVYNIGERVQSYTNPLMLFCMVIFSGITGEGYFSTLFINIATSMIAMYLVAFRLPKRDENGEITWNAVIPVLILIFSKSFVVYSTSGMENSLEHMLLAIFCCQLFRGSEWSGKRQYLLCLTATLLVFCRYDMVILVLPALCYVFFYKARKDGVKLRLSFLYGFLGVLPFILWEMFCFVYYGFLLPNTAYAKLNSGIPKAEYIWRGIEYAFANLSYDVVGVTAIVLALVVGFRTPPWKNMDGQHRWQSFYGGHQKQEDVCAYVYALARRFTCSTSHMSGATLWRGDSTRRLYLWRRFCWGGLTCRE